jgi:tripeptide aminopeptidase
VLATVRPRDKPGVPVVALLAHVDTAPDYNSDNVKPIVHKKWNGKPIVLPDDKTQVIDPARFPELARAKGQDVVTASGLTLLGGDDKSGVAIIMSLAALGTGIKHGPVRICSTRTRKSTGG